ncbi:MAG: DUF2085 domain-containing protein [Bacteroidetes bacterium]|nr:MAG: DUF2085 domain-containing protein [Bacteroidota bacterium]
MKLETLFAFHFFFCYFLLLEFMKQSTAYTILFLGALFWCLLLFLPPASFYLSDSDGGLTQAAYQLYARICHQYDSHSIHLMGHKLGVCARCSCIYFGFFFGVLFTPLYSFDRIQNHRRWLLFAIAPMLVDVLLNTIGAHESTMLTRVVTGLLFGVIAGLILTPLFVRGVTEIFNNVSHNARNLYESKT